MNVKNRRRLQSLWLWLKSLLPYAPLSPLSVLVAGGGISSTPKCQAVWSASRLPLSLQKQELILHHYPNLVSANANVAGKSCSEAFKGSVFKSWMTAWKPLNEGRHTKHVRSDTGSWVIVWVEEREMEMWRRIWTVCGEEWVGDRDRDNASDNMRENI